MTKESEQYLDFNGNPIQEGFYDDARFVELSPIYLYKKGDKWKGENIQKDNLLITPKITRRFKLIKYPNSFATNLRQQGNWMEKKLEQLTEQAHYDLELMNAIPFGKQE